MYALISVVRNKTVLKVMADCDDPAHFVAWLRKQRSYDIDWVWKAAEQFGLNRHDSLVVVTEADVRPGLPMYLHRKMFNDPAFDSTSPLGTCDFLEIIFI